MVNFQIYECFTLYPLFAEHPSNGDIAIIKEVSLISFEDPEFLELDSANKPHPPVAKERRELFRKRLKLVLSKGLFFALGALLFAAGCIFAVLFQHSDINEMCMLDDRHAINDTSAVSVSPNMSIVNVFTSTLPSPTATLTEQLQTLTKFQSRSI